MGMIRQRVVIGQVDFVDGALRFEIFQQGGATALVVVQRGFVPTVGILE